MSDNKKFFDERRDQSQIKAEIVHKYFFAWANVVKRAALMRGNKIAYIDLFAGPGRYKDGSISVPLLVLEKAADDDFLRENLVTIFNDKDEENISQLQKEVSENPKIKNTQKRAADSSW